jgi:hypothetical protein
MNNSPMLHPQAEELLLFVDGELPRSSRASIRNHLEGCWKCRTELEQLESVISEFMRYKSRLEASAAPVSRCSPAELRRKIEQLDSEMAGLGLFVRIQHLMGLSAFSAARRLSAGILALAGVGLALVLAHHFVPQFGNVRESSAPAPVLKPASPAAPPPKAGNSAPLANAKPKPEPEPAVTASAEVAAWVKLHDMGADLGEPVDVVSAGNGSATVVCRQMGQEREAEIRAAMAEIAGVSVHSEPAPPESSRRNPRATPSSGAGANPAEPVLIAVLGGRSAFDRLANEVLEADDAVIARAHAIRGIEERFPPGRMDSLDAADRAALERIGVDHRRAARESGLRLERLLAPAASALGAASPSVRPTFESGLFAAAQRMDRIVGVVFGGSPSALTVSELGAELNAARAQLATALEAR